MKKTAIFFNAAGIQKYVFNTNKLKHIVGASSIVNHLYDYLNNKSDHDLEKGYIGGGNALFFAKSKKDAEKTIKDFTSFVLRNYPGIVLNAAIVDNFNTSDSTGENAKNGASSADTKAASQKEPGKEKTETPKLILYKESMTKLASQAGKNTSKHFPLTNLPKHGITADCPYSGLSAEVKVYDNEGKKQYVSRSIEVRLSEDVEKKIKKSDDALLTSAKFDVKSYEFAKDFEDMGQEKGIDNHIAIVHIDGNGIGKLFQKCKSLEESQYLSANTKVIINDAFVEVLKELKKLIDEGYIKTITRKVNEKEKEKNILPLRPIILGGDDITFVCNSFLGIWLARSFMDNYSKVAEKQLEGTHADKSFTACAGVVITKTKYPFYRGYELAEELCQNAKKSYRKNESKPSNWLDFHLAQTDIPASLEEIRNKQFVDAKGNSILMRPYNEQQLVACINNTIHLNKNLPEGWGKELRDVLYQGESDWKMWQKKAQWRQKKYKIDSAKKEQDKQAYFDLIEMNEIIKPEFFPEPSNNDAK